MRWDRNSVREGMFVTSTKGERIGKVIRRDDDTFVVEKGTLFPKDYELRYDHITGRRATARSPTRSARSASATTARRRPWRDERDAGDDRIAGVGRAVRADVADSSAGGADRDSAAPATEGGRRRRRRHA